MATNQVAFDNKGRVTMLICNVGNQGVKDMLAEAGISPRLLSFDTERNLWLAYFKGGDAEALTHLIESVDELFVIEAAKAPSGETLIYLTDDPQTAYKNDWDNLTNDQQAALASLYCNEPITQADCGLTELVDGYLISPEGTLTSYGHLVVESVAN